MEENIVLKKCCRCKILKPLSEYSKCKKTKDNLDSHCKECERIRVKLWFEKNKEKVKKQQKKYYQANKEKIYQKSRLWYAKNKEKMENYYKEYNKEYRKKNKRKSRKKIMPFLEPLSENQQQ